MGIKHIDMAFDDGTCPPLALVRQFIRIADQMITDKGQAIAVHCKAGLGRTGCLIGAYLIYRHAFTANEVIAFMRFMRPGMVVGPQQHWLHLNQAHFRKWWFEDAMLTKLSKLPSTPMKAANSKSGIANSQTSTPPNNSKRAVLGEMDGNETSYVNQDENLPAPTPGQPRKTSRAHDRHHPYSRSASAKIQDDQNVCPTTEVISATSLRVGAQGESEKEEEIHFRLTSSRHSSRSPKNAEKRSVSYTTTTHCKYLACR